MYNAAENKSDFVCRAIVSYEEKTYDRLEERIKRIEQRLDNVPQDKGEMTNESEDKRVASIFEMHELFKPDQK